MFEASFFRTDGAVRRISVETGQASRDPRALLRLFHERMDALADPLDPGFGFDLIRLSVPRAAPLDTTQVSLDGEANRFAEITDMVDRLAARIGREDVLRFEAGDSHIPERAQRYASALSASLKRIDTPPLAPREPALRPTHVFDPPQFIEALAELPDGPPIRFRWRRVSHIVARAEGPERIAPEWFRERGRGQREEQTRDYYRVEDRHGRRFWLFRSGLYGESATLPRWYVHGLFA